jgi:hypothetical protein
VTAERTLSLRELNRALLARQLLLDRPALAAAEAIERVAGLQAQALSPPFVALWARLDGFDPAELRALIEAREVVRAPLMRHTVHMVTASDYLAFRGAVQRALERAFAGTRKRVDDEHLATAIEVARECFAAGPCTFADVKRRLEPLMPGFYDAGVMYGVRTYLKLICAPTGGTWSFSGRAPFVLAEDWLEQPVPDDDDPTGVIRRYLAAFGPASVADMQMWSGIPRLRPVVDAMRAELIVFRDEDGRELFDVPGAPLPDGLLPVPVRFTAEFDNALLGYADRRRIVADEHKQPVFTDTRNGRIPGTFLLDGFVAGRWYLERAKRVSTLVLEPFRRLTKAERVELEDAARPLAEFAEPEAGAHALRFAAPA